MATRSYIFVKKWESYKGIYCHFNGYPSGVGRILLKNYNSDDLANRLIDLGNIGSLCESLELTKLCLTNGDAIICKKLNDLMNLEMIQYVYLWKNNRWYYRTAGTFKPLTPSDCEENDITSYLHQRSINLYKNDHS